MSFSESADLPDLSVASASAEAVSRKETPESVLADLNPSQREAAQTTEGPVLVVAGPGSGKTRMLMHRIAYLLATQRARPWEILALTFTNKAAREMRSRIDRLAGPAARDLWMGTFHSIFARVLRMEGERIGYGRDFSIYDTDDSERVLRQLMQRADIDAKQYAPRSIRNILSGAKNRMKSPEEYARSAFGPFQQVAAQLYGLYEEALRTANAMDFDDLLLKPIALFNQHPDLLEKYRARWKYLHIDEYQDTNHAQYKLVNLLAGGHKNICVVGDDAQSIYAFRGADIANILSFRRDYPKAVTVRLEQNYRSTGNILRLAESIIGHNRDRIEKNLWTENGEGEPVSLIEAESEREEAQKIEREIRSARAAFGYGYEHFAVFYRTNAQSRSIEDALRQGGVPYRVVGGLSFYQRKEVKDMLAYLRLLINPGDLASLRRVINYPARGIGARTFEWLAAFAEDRQCTVWEAIEQAALAGLPPQGERAVVAFREMMRQHMRQVEAGAPVEDVARSLTEATGLARQLQQDGTPEESLARWQNVQELIGAIAEYAADNPEERTLSTFLQEMALRTDLDDMDDEARVTLMTLHASKGLEFPVAFVTGLEEGLFPISMAMQEQDAVEEERRLFYVGATRAAKQLYLSWARSRFRFGSASPSVRSRFLDEIDGGVVRAPGGSPIAQRKGRFQADPEETFDIPENSSYDQMAPHYYRRNLAAPARKANGRTVVYEEGEGAIAPGRCVDHPKFGQGEVLSVEGHGEQMRAVIAFQEAGRKKIMLKYAQLRLVEQ